MKIVSVDKIYLYPEHIEELEKSGQVVVYNDVPSREEGLKRIADAEIIIDNWYKMPAEVIYGCPKLKFICVAATGYEWIDMDACKKGGIVVSNSPSYSTEAVAELTVGLIINACRKITTAESSLRNGEWAPTGFKGKELRGKTLGIVGYGNIGRRVAEITSKGFGMKIIYVNSGSQKSDFERLIKESDIISVNAPITRETKGLIGLNEFNLMKDGVVIVNTGRGAVIDENALTENLKSGKVFSAGIDVYSKEPVNKGNPLFNGPNAILTPHIGFNTEESEFSLSNIVKNNVVSFLNGHPQNVVS